MALAPLVSAAIVIGSQAYNNLFGGEKTTIGTFEIDAVRAIDHNQEYVVNQKPVETGMEFTDQHIKKFAQINIEGILSNGKLTFEGFGDDFRKKEMALSKLADSGIPVELVTELKSYENVIFTNLNFNRTRETEGLLYFTCSLLDVKIIETKTAKGGTNVQDKNAKSSGKTAKNEAKKTGAQVDKGKVEGVVKKPIEKPRSLLLKGRDYARESNLL